MSLRITVSGPKAEVEDLRAALEAEGKVERVHKLKPFSADPLHQAKFSFETGKGTLDICFLPEGR